jgi:hypothetical protein
MDWSEEFRPFKRLKTLTTRGFKVKPLQFLVPSMTTLKISRYVYYGLHSWRNSGYCWQGLPAPITPNLRTVTFDNVRLTMEVLKYLITSPSVRNVDDLRFRRCDMGYYHSSHSQQWDMPVMLRTLEQHIPRLARFEWSGCLVRDQFRAFDTFKHLSCLRELHINDNLIATTSKEPFPKSLQHLHLDFVTVEQLVWFVDGLRNDIIQGEEDQIDFATQLSHLKLPIKNWTLSIELEQDNDNEEDGIELLELDQSTLFTPRVVVDALSQCGHCIKVNRAPGQYTRFHKYLVRPGWTAPLRILEGKWTTATTTMTLTDGILEERHEITELIF